MLRLYLSLCSASMELHVLHSLHQPQSGTRIKDQMGYCGDTAAIYYNRTNISAKLLSSNNEMFQEVVGFPSLQESKEKTAKMDCASAKLDRKTLERNKIGRNVAVRKG